MPILLDKEFYCSYSPPGLANTSNGHCTMQSLSLAKGNNCLMVASSGV